MRQPRTGFTYLDDADPVIALAHRGGAYHPEIEGLENTLAAFRHAASLGYRYLETDVHVTRDGVLLAFHDSVLDRVTDHRGEIATLTLEEVRKALVGGREAVPTLAELFDAFPDARFNIDLKSEAAVSAMADFLAERGAWDRVLVGSFSARRTARFRRLTGGRVPTCAGPLEIAIYRLLPRRAARLLTRRRFAAFQLPHRRFGIVLVTPRFVRRAHADDLHVHVWTIDDAAEMNTLLDRGVDGIFTDRTDILRDVLITRDQWRGAR